MNFAEVMHQALFSVTHFFDGVLFNGFIDIAYQAAIYTVMFFVFNAFFNTYVFKNRENQWPSLTRIFSTVFGFILYIMILRYFLIGVPAQTSTESITQAPKITLTSGQTFSAPEMEKIQKPLNIDIDFVQDECCEPVMTEVKTQLGTYRFSSHGAVLESMEFAWQDDSKQVVMLPEHSDCFLIGLSGQTPMKYDFVKKYDLCDLEAVAVEYVARHNHGTILKTFVVHKNTYQIDVKVSFEGRSKSIDGDQVRLFFYMPLLVDEFKGIVNSPTSSEKISLQTVSLDKSDAFKQFWFEPKAFGFSQKFLSQVCFSSSPDAIIRAYFKKLGDKKYQAILESKVLTKDSELSWSFYMGPKTAVCMKSVDSSLSGLVEYGWLNPISKPLFSLLVFLKKECGSYGIAIILLAILLKLLLLPFTLKGEKSLKQQAEFEKKRAYLQQKFKNDKAGLDQATAELLQKHGMPMLSGCLPMLLNIPVFIALNKVLTSSIELHGASFLWIPDLSAADPYYILSGLMFIGMILTPAVNQGPRQLASKFGFGLLVSAFTSYLASGLALYIALNTIFGVVQSYVIRSIGSLSKRFA